MKQKILKLTAFILFIGSFGCIYGTAGSSDLEYITNGQAFIRCIPALIILAADSRLINHLGKEETHNGRKN